MLYDFTVPQFTKMLRNLNHLLEKAELYSEAKKFDMGVLLQARLAPDQFPLIKQIQIVTDTAKLCVARLTGKEAPSHDDKELTLPELRVRIEQVMSFFNKISEKDFIGAEEKRITTPRWEGKSLSGKEFVIEHAVPNFYFHVTTAYAILRHNGVDLGKKDYLGEMKFK